jgi:hypothetical protein
MAWSYHSELVAMFCTIYFTRSGFLFAGLSIFLFQRPIPLDVRLRLDALLEDPIALYMYV